MKLKKLLTFVFGTSAALALCSCTEDKKVDIPPVEEDGNTDNTGGNTDNTGGNEKPIEPGKTAGELIVDAVEKQIEASETITITVENDYYSKESYWYSDENKYLDIEGNTDSKVVFTIAKMNDSYAVKAETSMTYLEDAFDKDTMSIIKKPVTHTTEVYVIDGYRYYKEDDLYIADKIANEEFDSISEIIDNTIADVKISIEDKTALLKFAADLVDQTIDVNTNKITLTSDIKPMYTAFIEYINGINGDTKTLEDLINEGLALVDPKLNVIDIIDAGVLVGKMTVNEAMTAIDEFLTENYQTTIQGVYDTVLADEKFVSAFTKLMLEEGMSQADIEAMLAQYKQIKISDLVSEVKDIPIFELVIFAMYSYPGSTAPDDSLEQVSTESTEDEDVSTIDDYVVMLKQIIAMPLNELDPNILENIKQIINGYDIKKLNNKIEVEFNSSYEIVKVSSLSEIDVTNTTPSYEEGKNNILTIKGSQSVEIELSKETTTIALPAGAIIINGPNGNKIPDELDCLDYWYYFDYDDIVSGFSAHDFGDDNEYDAYINFEDNYDGECYIGYVWLQYDGISQDGSTYTFKILECGIRNCGDSIITLAGTNLQALSSTTVTLTFNRTTGTLSVNIPTIDADKLQEVLNKYL